MNAEAIAAITPNEANAQLARNAGCLMIDVREYPEWAAEHVAGTRLTPLSSLSSHLGDLERGRPIFVLCRTGNRARQAARQLADAGYGDVRVVDGGIESWKKAALPVITGKSSVWSLERQVRFTAGGLVLGGLILAARVSPYFALLSAGIGFGLMFSAATDTCAMGMVLARMPWNRAPQSATCNACSN
jgi:rhodanese-related sulfurtransferase